MNLRKFLIGTGLVMVGIAALLLGVQTYERSQSFRGSLIEPSPPAWPIDLELADGTLFSLDDQKGKVILLFFGYANCPDFCPTTLAEFKQIYDDLGPEQVGQVEFVFITIDPERDTPQAIADFVNGFDPDFIGLSGSEEELQPIWDGYFVYREKQNVGSEAGYLMAHTTRVYVVDKQGRLRLTFPYGMAAEDMTRDIRRLLEE
jgi:protein SCO1/2